MCTVSYPDHMTSKGTPGRMIRIDDEVWAAYGQLCDEEGTSRADDIRRHVHARINTWQRKQKNDRDIAAAKNIAES